jgi:hypothetical protein
MQISQELAERALGQLRSCGQGRHECVVFLLADQAQRDVAVDVVHPPHTAAGSWFEVDGPSLTSLFIDLVHSKRMVLAQAHSHPGESVDHSPRDDAFPVLTTPGFVSIVVPEFGRASDPDEWGVHVLQAKGGWRRDPWAIRVVSARRQQALARTLDLLSELVDATRDEVDQALAAFVVRVSMTVDVWATEEGQAAFATLANLIVRSGMQLAAEVPSVPTVSTVPGFLGADFAEASRQAISGMLPGARLRSGPSAADLEIVLGNGQSQGAVELVVVSAKGQSAWTEFSGQGTWEPASVWTALAAAGIAAVEAHKAVLRRLPSHRPEDLEREAARFDVPFGRVDETDLGRFTVVSAGAISQNALYALSIDRCVRGEGTILDRDTVDISNLNRCPLVFVGDEGVEKVRVAASRARSIVRLPLAHHATTDDVPAIAGLPVLVGVDDIAARHVVQAMSPSWLGVGATSHMMAIVSEHAFGQGCAACTHPVLGDDIAVIPTVSIISFWAGFLLAIRFRWMAAGHPTADNQQVTTLWPLRFQGAVHTSQVAVRTCPLRETLRGHPPVPKRK